MMTEDHLFLQYVPQPGSVPNSEHKTERKACFSTYFVCKTRYYFIFFSITRILISTKCLM